MDSIFNKLITLDVSHNLASVPKTFDSVKFSGTNSLWQVNGANMAGGLLAFQQSPDTITWSAIKYRDTSSNLVPLKLSIDNSTNTSIELNGLTSSQYIRLVQDISTSGSIATIKVLMA